MDGNWIWNARYDQPVFCKSTGVSYYRYSSADGRICSKMFQQVFLISWSYEEFSDRCHCSFACTCRQREICCQKQNDGIYLYCPINGQICLYALCVLQTRLWWFHIRKTSDSAIIEFCVIWNVALDLPYPILISVIIGVTNVIPFLVLTSGAIPCILLILVVDPIKGLYFAILSCFFSSLMEISLVRNSRRLYWTFQFYGYCCHHDRGGLFSSGNDCRSSCICRTLCSDLEIDQSFS